MLTRSVLVIDQITVPVAANAFNEAGIVADWAMGQVLVVRSLSIDSEQNI
jgi:hypothetical protein